MVVGLLASSRPAAPTCRSIRLSARAPGLHAGRCAAPRVLLTQLHCRRGCRRTAPAALPRRRLAAAIAAQPATCAPRRGSRPSTSPMSSTPRGRPGSPRASSSTRRHRHIAGVDAARRLCRLDRRDFVLSSTRRQLRLPGELFWPPARRRARWCCRRTCRTAALSRRPSSARELHLAPRAALLGAFLDDRAGSMGRLDRRSSAGGERAGPAIGPTAFSARTAAADQRLRPDRDAASGPPCIVPRKLIDGAAVPIGRPIENTRVYVLDARISSSCRSAWRVSFTSAGAGLARGYLGAPG